MFLTENIHDNSLLARVSMQHLQQMNIKRQMQSAIQGIATP